MKSSSMIGMITIFCLILAASAFGQKPAQQRLKREIDQSERAARIFREIMDAPDQGIPRELLETAECIGFFQSVSKAGVMAGGRAMSGVVSCRTSSGWSGPAFFNLESAGFGHQADSQSTDLVLLFMSKPGFNRLLSDKFEIGADTSSAAGPVGRQTGASTVFDFDAHILSYSRNRGILSGFELKGAVITPGKDSMRHLYGEGVTVKEVLKENEAGVPASVLAFPIILRRYSSRIPE